MSKGQPNGEGQWFQGQLRRVGELAVHFGVPVHRIEYILRTRPEIKPCNRVGVYRLYDTASLKRIAEELQLSAHRTSASPEECVDQTGWSVRAGNLLTQLQHQHGPLTFRDIAERFSETDLLRMRNFGLTSLNEIKRALAERGLRLPYTRTEGATDDQTTSDL